MPKTKRRMTKTAANLITGGLSDPSKMPGRAIGLPAIVTCRTGAKLAQVPGTPCSKCYATRNFYRMPNVQEAEARRHAAIEHALSSPEAREEWITAMVRLVGDEAWFRWFDAGDLYRDDLLDLIIDVVRRTPNTRHWLPTQERATVKNWLLEHGRFPENLTVRISMTKIDATPEAAALTRGAIPGVTTSSVSTTDPTCPARLQDNECRDCRACWNADVPHVAYAKH